MIAALETALAQGAFGLSTGLEYVPGRYTPTAEIVSLARVVARHGGLYASHIRNEESRLLEAVAEAIEIGRLSGVRVQISHLKAAGEVNWPKQRAALDLIESARAHGIEVPTGSWGIPWSWSARTARAWLPPDARPRRGPAPAPTGRSPACSGSTCVSNPTYPFHIGQDGRGNLLEGIVDEARVSNTARLGRRRHRDVRRQPLLGHPHLQGRHPSTFTYNILASAVCAGQTYLQNDLVVPSTGNDRLNWYDNTGAPRAPAQTGPDYGLDYPEVIIGPDGHVYATGYNSNNVVRYDATTGAVIDEFIPAGSGGVSLANGSKFGPDGHYYLASEATSEVLRYDGASGAYIDVFVAAGSGGLNEATGLVFGPDGNLYISDWANDAVYRYERERRHVHRRVRGLGQRRPRQARGSGLRTGRPPVRRQRRQRQRDALQRNDRSLHGRVRRRVLLIAAGLFVLGRGFGLVGHHHGGHSPATAGAAAADHTGLVEDAPPGDEPDTHKGHPAP